MDSNNFLSAKQAKVYNAIKKRIKAKRYKPGDKLIENDLADQLNVSRTSIRAAYKFLAQEGYIKLVPNQGAYIADFTSEEIWEFFLIRESLEKLATKLAVNKISEEKLIEYKKAFIEAEKSGNRYDILEIGDDFHQYIIDVGSGKRLKELIELLQVPILLIRNISETAPGRIYKSFQEHKDILDAMIRGDEEEATRLVGEHIVSTRNGTMNMLLQQGNLEKQG